MIKMELLHQIYLAIPDYYPRSVVPPDILVCQTEYVEKQTPFKWVLVQTSRGPAEAVSNTAVSSSSDGRVHVD